MKRIHFFEWEDLRWFPTGIRDLMTDYLRYIVGLFKMYEPTIPILERFIQDTKTTNIVDLASGGGGPWINLAAKLKKNNSELQVTLTDLYPNITALQHVQNTNPDVFTIEKQSINALDVPEKYQGIRTQFLSLHHFKQEQVKEIFKNAIDNKQPIAVFEFQERSVSQVIQFMLAPVFVLLLSIAIRPFSWKRLLFTYLIPVVPFFIMWDGIVSALRTYKPHEIKNIVASIPEAESYIWDIDSIKKGPAIVLYATGRPKP